MSYILDALKKSEAEKNPDIRTSLAAQDRNNHRQQVIQYLMIAALIGNGLLLIWLFAPLRGNTPATQDSMTISEGAAIPQVAPLAATRPASIQAASNGSKTSQQQPELRSSAAVSIAAPPPPKLTRTTISGLPGEVRSRFPGLAFSTHVYASDPAMRAVVVNGQRLTEGDQLGNLQLTEITEDGVVMRFENYLVAVPVLDGWQ